MYAHPRQSFLIRFTSFLVLFTMGSAAIASATNAVPWVREPLSPTSAAAGGPRLHALRIRRRIQQECPDLLEWIKTHHHLLFTMGWAMHPAARVISPSAEPRPFRERTTRPAAAIRTWAASPSAPAQPVCRERFPPHPPAPAPVGQQYAASIR